MKLRDGLGRVPAKHRSIVAETIGLARRASVEEIEACLLDERSLARIVAGLSPSARGAAVTKALWVRQPPVYTFYGQVAQNASIELERHGLAFAFRGSWANQYVVAEDLQPSLACALATVHTGKVKVRHAERWAGAPLALAHDAAALWAALHREPARVKTDGVLYQRAWPKLLGALPALDLFGPEDAFGSRRLDAALAVLREESCVRVRLDDSSGWETKRELVAAGELAPVLALGADELRARVLADLVGNPVDTAGMTMLAAVASRGEVSLASFGAALRGLLAEAGERPDSRAANVDLALLCVQLAWLVGLAEIGFDAGGAPVAVRERSSAKPGLRAVGPEGAQGLRAGSDPGGAHGGRPGGPRGGSGPEAVPAGPRAVCQGNFEIVLLAPPTPAERLRLELACEAVAGQPHVYRITRGSVAVGECAGVGPRGVLGVLESLAGGLPQNVARSVADWARGCGPPLRVRTAMMLDAGDSATADALAGGALKELVAERVGDSLLAFGADRMTELRVALATVGRELEPGLDRISGRWEDKDRGQSAVEREWTPRAAQSSPPGGRLVSTVKDWTPPKSKAAAPVAGPATALPAPGSPVRLVSNGGCPARPSPAQAAAAGGSPAHPSPARVAADAAAADPLEVILDAIEDESDVMIIYAGAGGVTYRCVAPIEIESSALRAYCHEDQGERQFWMGSIVAATAVAE
ncbi:MAG: hypothetical protein ACR2IP_05180 [Solirubrobacteraceae bacterium]